MANDEKVSGYHHCGCRDCFEIAVGEPGAFCWECRESECEPDSECRSPNAYGGGVPPIALPDVDEVSEELEAIARSIDPHDRYAGVTLDVRLQVLENGDWRVHVGLACYDADHQGYWGASEISHPSEYVESIGIASDRVARDLVDQAAEGARQDGRQVEGDEK